MVKKVKKNDLTVLLALCLTATIFIPMLCQPISAQATSIIPESDWKKLTSHSQGADMPDCHPDGSEIVYITWDEDQLGSLYKMKANGSDQSGLGVSRVGSPDISPDGTQIACEGFGQIWIMNYDGSDCHPIYGTYTSSGGPGAAGCPRWSPSGDRLAIVVLTTQYDRRIVTIKLDGSDPTPLTDSVETCGYPSWSPDGTRIAYQWERDIWIMNSDGSNKHWITNFNDAGFPVWSPKGSSIFFCRFYGTSWADAHIYKMNADGTNVVQLTNSTGEWWPSISTDEKWMTFTSGGEKGRNIHRVLLTTAKPPFTIWSEWWFWAIIGLCVAVVVPTYFAIRYRRMMKSKVKGNKPIEKTSHKRCPNCGAQLPIGAEFCGKCGNKLD